MRLFSNGKWRLEAFHDFKSVLSISQELETRESRLWMVPTHSPLNAFSVNFRTSRYFNDPSIDNSVHSSSFSFSNNFNSPRFLNKLDPVKSLKVFASFYLQKDLSREKVEAIEQMNLFAPSHIYLRKSITKSGYVQQKEKDLKRGTQKHCTGPQRRRQVSSCLPGLISSNRLSSLAFILAELINPQPNEFSGWNLISSRKKPQNKGSNSSGHKAIGRNSFVLGNRSSLVSVFIKSLMLSATLSHAPLVFGLPKRVPAIITIASGSPPHSLAMVFPGPFFNSPRAAFLSEDLLLK
nr:hypothetical protein Iba_chr02dCG11840 [Ipomoea batatas]